MRRRWVALLATLPVVAACSRGTAPAVATSTSRGAPSTSTTAANRCDVPLQATDVGVTPSDITIEVMADVGSPLAPGLFQGDVDAVNAFAAYVNARGGLACRTVKVRMWDSKLDPTESKNGEIDSCENALAMVGTSAAFSADVSTLNTCPDRSGQPTGLPDITALDADVNEQCAPTAFHVQGVPTKCPAPKGPDVYLEPIGYLKWQARQSPGLHGLFLIPGDLPSSVEAGVPQYIAGEQAGIQWDATPKVSGADSQPAYTPRVQLARSKASTFVFDASNDAAMLRMRKEAAAQGLDSVKVWACLITCYTKAYLNEGGNVVEGTYVWMNYLPFEEAGYNAEAQAYVDAVGASKVDPFGAAGWQAAVAFEDAVNAVVAEDGPNGLTRATLLAALQGMTHFSAHGWMGTRSLQGAGSMSPCFLVMQVQNGRFVRVYPTQPGTMDCDPSNLTAVTVDTAAVAATLKS